MHPIHVDVSAATNYYARVVRARILHSIPRTYLVINHLPGIYYTRMYVYATGI